MQNDSLIRPIEKCFFGGQKKEDLTPGANRSQRNTPTTETRFWMHWAKIYASHGKLWTHWRNQKFFKKHARVQLHPYAQHTPHFRRPLYFACVVGLLTQSHMPDKREFMPTLSDEKEDFILSVRDNSGLLICHLIPLWRHQTANILVGHVTSWLLIHRMVSKR